MQSIEDNSDSHNEDSTVKIDRFVGDFAFLSNFFPSTVYIDGKRYPTVEHAYQAMKTLDLNSRECIRNAKTPAIAKKLGRSVELRKDWDDIRVQIMYDLLEKKFDNPFLKPMLLATNNAVLIEGNNWNDRFWGVCRGTGQNKLGELLMKVRTRLFHEV